MIRPAPPATSGERRRTTARLVHADVPGRLQDLSLELSQGECLVLVGPNGAGKSSVLRALLGLLPLRQGEVALDERSVMSLSPAERAARLAWLPQRPRLSSELTICELVQRGRFRFLESSVLAQKSTQPLLSELGIAHLAERRTTEVSGGELQRALLATLIAQNSPLLLVDEPANHLDPAHQLETYQRLGQLWQRGHGLLIVTHDIRLCQLLGPPEQIRVVGLSAGSLAFQTTLSDPALARALEELYGVPFIQPGQAGALALSLPREEGS